jgi:hypothetical protein
MYQQDGLRRITFSIHVCRLSPRQVQRNYQRFHCQQLQGRTRIIYDRLVKYAITLTIGRWPPRWRMPKAHVKSSRSKVHDPDPRRK